MPYPELKILGIDPGGTTGWARLVVPRKSIYGDEPRRIIEWEWGEVYGPEEKQVDELAGLVRATQGLSYQVGPAVVVEDFDIEPHNRTRDREMLSPVRIAAMLRYAQHLGKLQDAQIVMQGRQLAKGTATDDRLRHWGLYIKGSDHARDAMRHAITALRRASENPAFLEKMWRRVP